MSNQNIFKYTAIQMIWYISLSISVILQIYFLGFSENSRLSFLFGTIASFLVLIKIIYKKMNRRKE